MTAILPHRAAPGRNATSGDRMKPPRGPRGTYASFRVLTTRWRDNDVYGHMNNAVYYEFFDTAVNRWLIEAAGLSVPGGEVVGLVVASSCVYHAGLGWPEPVEAGLGIGRLGRSAITFRVGLFGPGEPLAAAEATFTHVYVDKAGRRPVPLPEGLHAAAARLAAETGGTTDDDRRR
jgi:acyl-CoA thioester hydrolase